MSGRFDEALARIDAVHAEDPEKDAAAGRRNSSTRERMSAWLEKLAPQASERAQARGALPASAPLVDSRAVPIRKARSATCAGARRSRSRTRRSPAKSSRRRATAPTTVKRVQSLIKKERIKHDPEAQLLEDATCLVFLEFEFAAFAAKHDEAKLIDILRKTWAEDVAAGAAAALGLQLPAPLRALVGKALAQQEERDRQVEQVPADAVEERGAVGAGEVEHRARHPAAQRHAEQRAHDHEADLGAGLARAGSTRAR